MRADLTIVASDVDDPVKIVPEPVTVSAPVPDCGIYTGPVYGDSRLKVTSVDVVQEKIVYRKSEKKIIVNRPVEVVKAVPKVIVKQVVKFKKVVDPNDIIEIEKPYQVETKKYVPNFKDKSKYAIVSERKVPVVSYDENDRINVPCKIAEPTVEYVDVYVPKIVDGCIVTEKGKTKLHRLDSVSQAQWNTLVLKMNPHLCKTGDLSLVPVFKNRDGQVIAYEPSPSVGKTL